jgi:hypothetical protein
VSTLPRQHDQSSEVSGRPRKNIFEDPAIVEAGKNDPFIRFVSANWRLLLVTLVAIGFGIVAYSQFSKAAQQKSADSTRILRQVHEAYQEVLDQRAKLAAAEAGQRVATDDKARAEAAESAKKSAEAAKQQEDRLLSMLSDLEATPSFSAIAGLYRGLVAAGRADYAAVQAALAANSWETVGKPGSPERAAAELASLGLAKALSDSSEHLSEAKSALKQLAERGEFAAARAVDAFVSLATSQEDKDQAKSLIQAVQGRMPAQQKILSEASERLAFGLRGRSTLRA